MSQPLCLGSLHVLSDEFPFRDTETRGSEVRRPAGLIKWAHVRSQWDARYICFRVATPESRPSAAAPTPARVSSPAPAEHWRVPSLALLVASGNQMFVRRGRLVSTMPMPFAFTKTKVVGP
jgi:hypothetical protein